MWWKIRHPVARKRNRSGQSQAKQPLFLVAPDKTAGGSQRTTSAFCVPDCDGSTCVSALFHMENWREIVGHVTIWPRPQSCRSSCQAASVSWLFIPKLDFDDVLSRGRITPLLGRL